MTFTAFLTLFEKKSFYKCQIHDIMSKNESRDCIFCVHAERQLTL